jgi:hypothetical protein
MASLAARYTSRPVMVAQAGYNEVSQLKRGESCGGEAAAGSSASVWGAGVSGSRRPAAAERRLQAWQTSSGNSRLLTSQLAPPGRRSGSGSGTCTWEGRGGREAGGGGRGGACAARKGTGH